MDEMKVVDCVAHETERKGFIVCDSDEPTTFVNCVVYDNHPGIFARILAWLFGYYR